MCVSEEGELIGLAPLPYKHVFLDVNSSNQQEGDGVLHFFVNKVATELTRDAFKLFGFSESSDMRKCNAIWGRQLTDKEYSLCLPHQKVNHFCGSFLLGRKDHFHHRMKELRTRIGQHNFYPDSFLLPSEKEQALASFADHPIWIFKPAASSGGRGIKFILSQAADFPQNEGVLQVYIDKPYLIRGRKFDIRLYVLVTSIDPIRMYIYDNGLARFATHDYQKEKVDDLQGHLTNAKVNSCSENYVRGKLGSESIENSKWSLTFLFQFLASEGVDTEALMRKIEKAVISTMISGLSVVKGHHQRFIKSRYVSYELFGVDVLVDENLNISILEVNISPVMSGKDSELDHDLKWPMMLDILNLARIIDCDARFPDPCPGLTRIERACDHAITPGRVSEVESGTVDPWEAPNFVDITNVYDYIDEQSRRGHFRLLFPRSSDAQSFVPCFPKLTYHDAVFISWISRSRQERSALLSRHIPSYITKITT